MRALDEGLKRDLLAALLFAFTAQGGALVAQPTGAAPDSTLADTIWTELTELDWTATCEDWRQERTARSCDTRNNIADHSPDYAWCALGQQTDSRGHRRFYALTPERPGDCRLGGYEAYVSGDSARVAQMRDRLERLIRAEHGEPSDSTPPRGGILWQTWRGEITIEPWQRAVWVTVRTPALGAAHAAAWSLRERVPRILARADSTLADEIGPDFPDLSAYMPAFDENAFDYDHGERLTLDLLGAADTASGEPRARLLFAADRVASHIFKRLPHPFPPDSAASARLARLATHGLTVGGEKLGSSWWYDHDPLWEIWSAYPDTRWGEDAFVVLLASGWNMSPFCGNGDEEFRAVIREADAFLANQPSGRHTLYISFLLAQAYDTWWSVSQAKNDDYANPADYQEGAEVARSKATQLYDSLVSIAPESDMAVYARPQLGRLTAGIDSATRRFFCVYD